MTTVKYDESRRALLAGVGAVLASAAAAGATSADKRATNTSPSADSAARAGAAQNSVPQARHPFRDLNLARTAHLIIDMQNGFLEPGAPVEVAAARAIVPNVNRLSEAVRARGGQNVFLRFVLGPESLQSWSVWYAKFGGAEVARQMSESFADGSHFASLWPQLEVKPQDLVVPKRRFSAFIPGTCDLHQMLQRRGIDTVIITGTLTNCCCESTARDAQQMNYRVLFASDATAAMTDGAHRGTLENMSALFADVASTDELIGFIEASRSA